MNISFKAVGKRRRLLDDFQIDWPPVDGTDRGGNDPLTLRQVITRIVLAETEAFRQRQRSRRFASTLSDQQIIDAAELGKVDMGGRDLKQTVDDDEAVGTALEAFEDGIYLVLIDGLEQRDLDAEVFVTPESQIVFLRLTMLAGA